MANRLRTIREESGFSCQEIAEKFDISEQDWIAFEEGKKIPSDLLESICNYLVISKDYLLDKSDVKHPGIEDDAWIFLMTYKRANPDDQKLVENFLRRAKNLTQEEQDILNAYDVASEEMRNIVDIALDLKNPGSWVSKIKKIKPICCSFCGKEQDELELLIAGNGSFICPECVELCQDIIKEYN